MWKAQEEAAALGRGSIGPLELLLGLLREGTCECETCQHCTREGLRVRTLSAA